MKKLLWITLAVSSFAFAQTGVEEMPESAEALLSACEEQAKSLPAEAVDIFNNTCSCLAESIDFEQVKTFNANKDQAGLVSHIQEATLACAPEAPAS